MILPEGLIKLCRLCIAVCQVFQQIILLRLNIFQIKYAALLVGPELEMMLSLLSPNLLIISLPISLKN